MARVNLCRKPLAGFPNVGLLADRPQLGPTVYDMPFFATDEQQGYVCAETAANVFQWIPLNFVPRGFWACDTCLMPPGSRASTNLALDVGILQSVSGFIAALYTNYIGDAANGAGQTVTIRLQVNNGITFADVPGATTGPLATAGACMAAVR